MCIQDFIKKMTLVLKDKVFRKKTSDLNDGYVLWNAYKKKAGLSSKSRQYSNIEVKKIMLAMDDENKRLRNWTQNSN